MKAPLDSKIIQLINDPEDSKKLHQATQEAKRNGVSKPFQTNSQGPIVINMIEYKENKRDQERKALAKKIIDSSKSF